MKTKELIEWLELQIAYNRASIPHHGYFRAIIKSLQHYDTLLKKYNALTTTVHKALLPKV
jgi:hypothetical protein